MIEKNLDQYALNVVCSLMPEAYNKERLPSMRQCVGTNRLWGASLGQALHDDLNGSIELSTLVDIAILSRSILVLDDHIEDEYLDIHDVLSISEFIDNLERKLFIILRNVGESCATHNDLREISRQEVAKRNQSISIHDIYRSSINKCLIFFNPYRLEVAKKVRKWKERLHFLEIFFFACQLLDDYQDLEVDRAKKANHNIFYMGRSNLDQTLIEQEHLAWVPALLEQIQLNLTRTDVKVGSSQSSILSYFHSVSISFTKLMISKCEGHKSGKQEIMRFEEWKFDPLNHIADLKLKSSYHHYIRPEFMQTYMKGFRDIMLV